MSNHHLIDGLHIRWMIRRDFDEVLEIEQTCFADPWERWEIRSFLRQRNCLARVAEVRLQIVGYMLYAMHHDELELVNLATDPLLFRSGIATELIHCLKSKLGARRKRIRAMVSERNVEAQLFFRSQGFRAVEIKRQPYVGAEGDGYVMHYDLAVHHDEPLTERNRNVGLES